MKTTLELPDELARRVKIEAVKRNQKLKDAVAQLLELGLTHLPENDVSTALPLPIRLKGGPTTIDEIEVGISMGRDA